MSLLSDLLERGLKLEPKLTFSSEAPLDAETLALLKAHKADLLRELAAPDSVPRLPPRLERLLSAAGNGNLPRGVVTLEAGFVADLNSYVLAWAAAYLTGDRTEALKCLWEAHRAWQGVN